MRSVESGKSSLEVRTFDGTLISQIVEVHFEAFKGYMNTRLGRRYVRQFYEWFVTAEDSINLAALNNSESVAGFVVGAPLGYGARLSKDLFWTVAGSLFVRPWLLFHSDIRQSIFGRLYSLVWNKRSNLIDTHLPVPSISLVGIGVASSMAGRGIGTVLMTEFEKYALRGGYRSMRLSVYPDNTSACALYKKTGWELLSESAVPGKAVYYGKSLHS